MLHKQKYEETDKAKTENPEIQNNKKLINRSSCPKKHMKY